MHHLAHGLVRESAAARALHAGDEQLQDAHEHHLVGGRVGHLEAAVGRCAHDCHDRFRLGGRIEREQPRLEEGVNSEQRPLRDDAARVLLPNGLQEGLDVFEAAHPPREHGAARLVEVAQQLRAGRGWRSVGASRGSPVGAKLRGYGCNLERDDVAQLAARHLCHDGAMPRTREYRYKKSR